MKNAMYTDPDDQSVWIYHRWLIGDGKSYRRSDVITVSWILAGDDSLLLQREIASIQELLDEQPDSKCAFVPIEFIVN